MRKKGENIFCRVSLHYIILLCSYSPIIIHFILISHVRSQTHTTHTYDLQRPGRNFPIISSHPIINQNKYVHDASTSTHAIFYHTPRFCLTQLNSSKVVNLLKYYEPKEPCKPTREREELKNSSSTKNYNFHQPTTTLPVQHW